MKRATSILLRAVAWSVAALVGVALPMTQAVADHPPTPVGVHDDANGAEYTPTVVEIYVGDRLHWVWDAANAEHHTVTSAELPEPVFDSDDACEASDSGRLGPCRKGGATFSHKFTVAGEYEYYCKVHGSAVRGPWGTVLVKSREAHPSPSPSPSDSPSGSETETGSESPSEEPSGSGEPTEPSEEPTDDGTSEPTAGPTPTTSTSSAPTVAPSASASPSPSPSAYRPTRVGGEVPGGGVVFEPAPEQVYTEGGTERPNVAPPEERESEASPFPSAPELDDPSEIAIDIPGSGRGPGRPLLAGIAVGGVLLTCGAFSTLVLFAPPWA